MRRIKLVILCLLLAVANVFAQTDDLNFKKYWKFRNSFRQNFIKIGPERGESLPMGRRDPGKCQDNIAYNTNYGWLWWGDGMIRQGHYIGFLATEYRLLKDNNQDVTAVLNELYYALNAINRVDLDAEPIITGTQENNMPVEKPQSLNGFYLREDVPEEFAEHWQNEPIKSRCISSAIYLNDNAAHSNAGNFTAMEQTDYHSIPSLDQMTSLLVGLAVCDKLLDNGLYVKPTESDPVMELRNEVKQITNRIISYALQHNWFLLDEWGWPVGNGGGDLFLTAYPITVIGENIVGNNYSSTMKRRAHKYKVAQQYYTLPTQQEKDNMWDTLSFSEKQQVNNFSNYNPWPLNIGGPSNFEEYQSDPSALEFSTDFSSNWWETIIPALWPDMYQDWLDDYKFDDTFPWWAGGNIEFDAINIADYNNTILFNLGVASGLWTPNQVFEWGTTTGNYQLVLINSVLNGGAPAYGDKPFFELLLSSMPIYGGFKFGALENWQDPTSQNQVIWSGGWGGEYKWTHAGESNSEVGVTGQFSALDYMYLHNLYYLVYGDLLPEYEEKYDCICSGSSFDNLNVSQSIGTTTHTTIEAVVANDITILPKIAYSLSFLEHCTSSAFSDFINNELSTSYDLNQLFDDYHEFDISLNKYQTEEFVIKDNGELNIESRLVICETKILTVEDGGIINLNKGEIRVNHDAELIIEGDVVAAPETKIILNENAKLIIRSGGSLINSGYIELKEGAELIYEPGAYFSMPENLAALHFNGGQMIIKENATFTFDHPNTASGYLRFSKPGIPIIAEDNTNFEITGIFNGDHIIVLDEDAEFYIEGDGLSHIFLQNGMVRMEESSKFIADQIFTSANIKYEAFNQGPPEYLHPTVYIYKKGTIGSSEFEDVRIEAQLYMHNFSNLQMYHTDMMYTYTEDIAQLEVFGQSAYLSDCQFDNFSYRAVNLAWQTQTTTIFDCTFNGEPGSTHIVSNGDEELILRESNFNNGSDAVIKLGGKLLLKCNSFDGFTDAAVRAITNCYLEMGTNSFAGYNTFTNISGYNIYLDNAQYMQLASGFNVFDDGASPYMIAGSVQIGPPSQYMQFLPAQENLWNGSGSTPSQGFFNVISSITGHDIPIMANNPETANCGTMDPSTGGPVIPGGSNSSAMIITTNFDHVKMADAISETIEETELRNSTKDDLIAIERFEEILTYDVNNINKATRFCIDFGTEYVKHTLQHTFETGKICRDDNNICFHQGVQDYVDVLNYLTEYEDVNDNNYVRMFNLEMDKVFLFHQLGSDDIALYLIGNMEQCGLDYKEQVYVNEVKYAIEKEIAMRNYGYQAPFKDTVWVDTSAYIQPIEQDYGQFGSYIPDRFLVECFNCMNPKSQLKNDQSDNVDFSIYPNPSNGEMQITYYLPEGSDGVFIVYDMAGKEIYKFNCQSGNRFAEIKISGVQSGAYIYSYQIDGIQTKSGRLVIEK